MENDQEPNKKTDVWFYVSVAIPLCVLAISTGVWFSLEVADISFWNGRVELLKGIVGLDAFLMIGCICFYVVFLATMKGVKNVLLKITIGAVLNTVAFCLGAFILGSHF